MLRTFDGSIVRREGGTGGPGFRTAEVRKARLSLDFCLIHTCVVWANPMCKSCSVKVAFYCALCARF